MDGANSEFSCSQNAEHQEEMEFYHNYCMNHSKFVLAAGRMWMGRCHCHAYSIITVLLQEASFAHSYVFRPKKDSMNDTHFT